ncbi:MAG: hypothetical protein HQK83_04945 [Fibrobacteria bacterium]|nr:hypothetical protein [Fibrobacteria bacterium]
MNRLIVSLLIMLLLLLIACSENATLTGEPGTGSETTNGIAALVVDENGAPVVSARVFIRPKDFLEDTSGVGVDREPDAYSDTSGKFFLDSVAKGEYVIEILSGDDSAALVECTKEDIDTLNIGEIKVTPVASFSGNIDRQNIPPQVNIYVQVYGLDRIQRVGPQGEFRFEGMPPGDYKLRMLSNDTSLGITDSAMVKVGPADTLNVGTFLMPFEFWRDTLVVRKLLDTNGLDSVPVIAVTVAHMGRIVELNLTNRNIKTIPPNIGRLRLFVLRLGKNNIDTIPFELGFMHSLSALFLDSNNINILPLSFFNLGRLERLDLTGNNLITFPPELGRLGMLKVLTLRDNDMQFIPESIEHLINLKALDLSFNNLNGLPGLILKITGLDVLNVNNNKICSMPIEIENWINTFSMDKNWKNTQVCPAN